MTATPHDQTRGDSTPFFRDSAPAPLSCNEAVSLCMKAARGAGMSWGMAEEAGFSAAWLVSHGVDGPSHLCAHLMQADGRDWADLCPAITPGDWQNARGRTNCPIILGATLCDFVELPEGLTAGSDMALGVVSTPILLLPFLFELARMKPVCITLTGSAGQISTDDKDACLQKMTQILGQGSDALTLSFIPAAVQTQTPFVAGLMVAKATTTAETIQTLNTFAMRTVVPASDASRAGAGSTLSDND
ncbi:Protein of unknown function [Loktanella sp. DSM 29012]|uniref:DUF3726 domain-containing protein n=1 Tax=Loktanella sp. DSM 29012 TaxID=1881056 RepID=UPI0008CCED32|nr:DUF3726 domain-containing protein [Loktanella sp. DSM 29012]SEQ83132.1 Protein of unknown function [Loktanella sp. DSM 29012]